MYVPSSEPQSVGLVFDSRNNRSRIFSGKRTYDIRIRNEIHLPLGCGYALMTLSVQYVVTNIFALSILLVILQNMRREDGKYSTDQKLFFALINNAGFLLMLDSVIRVFNGRPGGLSRAISIAAIVLYNCLNPVICMIWYHYIDYYLFGSEARLAKPRLAILVPVFLNLFLSVGSVFRKIYYVYDAHNVYSRGPFIYALLGICLYLILYTSTFLFRNRSRIGRAQFISLFSFALFPSFASVVQMLVPGLDIIWAFTTVSVLIIFVNIQKGQLYTDYLTDLNNRRLLDSYLQSKLERGRKGMIAGIMIDIDSFKMINDLYGHDSGDQALKQTAQILKQSFRKSDFIARFGGDEFVVILEIDRRGDLDALVGRLEETTERLNAHRTAPYKLHLSIGCACYPADSKITAAEFLKEIDRQMYSNKQENMDH